MKFVEEDVEVGFLLGTGRTAEVGLHVTMVGWINSTIVVIMKEIEITRAKIAVTAEVGHVVIVVAEIGTGEKEIDVIEIVVEIQIGVAMVQDDEEGGMIGDHCDTAVVGAAVIV